jgi:hypothetical protein
MTGCLATLRLDRGFFAWAMAWALVSLLAFGVIAAIIPSPVFGRQIPARAVRDRRVASLGTAHGFPRRDLFGAGNPASDADWDRDSVDAARYRRRQ